MVIGEMGSVSPLFDLVKIIGNGYERYRICSQNAIYAHTREKHIEDLWQILLVANSDNPSRELVTSKQRYNTLCIQLGTISLLGMYYTILAVLNVVDVLKYWQMAYDEEDSTTDHLPGQTNAGV